ncbi:hypothetical protein JTB14_007828 [Gonioctena quinquepunctata]|nr:hypothetical protein JTB14_007828 [Gonioctena quinquepunctata]
MAAPIQGFCELSEHEGVLPSDKCDRDIFLKTYPENCENFVCPKTSVVENGSQSISVEVFGKNSFSKSNMLPENLYNSQNFEVKRSHGFQSLPCTSKRKGQQNHFFSSHSSGSLSEFFNSYDGSLGQQSYHIIGIQRDQFFWSPLDLGSVWNIVCS